MELHLDEEARNCHPYSRGCGSSSTEVQPHLAQMTTRYEGREEKENPLSSGQSSLFSLHKISPLETHFLLEDRGNMHFLLEDRGKSFGLMRRDLAF